MDYNTYLSDDEDEYEINATHELDQYGMIIEDVDENEILEIRRIVSDKMLSNNVTYEENTLSKKNTFKLTNKKAISLNDLNNYIDKKIEDKKPKKFVSKRSIEKKNLELELPKIIIKESKRTFNPRLVPYLFSDEYKNKIMLESKKLSFDNLEFPNL